MSRIKQILKKFFSAKNWYLLAVLLIGLCLRVYRLAVDNIWYDEFISLQLTRYWRFLLDASHLLTSNFWELIATKIVILLKTIFPLTDSPLYSLLLGSWAAISGESLFSLRLPSVIFSFVSLILIYKLGKLLVNKQTGLISAFIMSLSPIHVWYAQEARKYSLTVLLSIITIYLLILFLRNKTKRAFFLFIFSFILSFLASYFMGLCLLISVGLIFLIKSYRKYLKYYIVLVGTLIILITPFYDIILNFIDAVVLRFWLLPPPPEAPFITLANFTLGYNALKVSYFAFAVVFLVLFIIGLFCLRHQKRKRFLVLSLFLPPLVGGYFISQQIPIYLDRQFLFISPVYYIIVALAISKIKYKIVRFVFIGFYCLAVINPLANYYNFNMPLGSYYHVGVYPKKPDKDVVNYLRENLKDGDIVAVSEPHAWRFEYYFDNYGCMSNSYFFFIDSLFKRNQPYYYNALKEIRREKVKHGFPLINLVNLEQNTSEIIAVPHISAYNFSRIWLISTSWGRDGKFPPHVVRVRNWLNYNWHKAKTRRFPGIIIDLYQKNKDCK